MILLLKAEEKKTIHDELLKETEKHFLQIARFGKSFSTDKFSNLILRVIFPREQNEREFLQNQNKNIQ